MSFLGDLWDSFVDALESIVDFASDLLGSILDGLLGIYDDVPEDFGGTTVTKVGNVELLPVVYGERSVGGIWIYTDVTGSKNDFIWMVFALADADSPIEDIVSFTLDEVLSTDPKYSGVVVSEQTLGIHTTQPFTQLQGESVEWTSQHLLLGTAAIALRLKWDIDVFRGLPKVTFKIRGCKLLDINDLSENLLTRSEEFDHADWVIGGTPVITVDSTVAPDGTTTADTIEDDDAVVFESVRQAGSIVVTSLYTFSIFVLKDGVGRATRFLQFNLRFLGSTTEDNTVKVDTSTGEFELAGPDSSVSGSVESHDSDWWRVSLTAKSQDQANSSFTVFIFPAAGASATWVTDATITGSIIVWGAQVVIGDYIPVYFKTTTTAKPLNVRLYSQNPAEVLFDYLTNPIYGKGLSIADGTDIDLQSFLDAKNYCNELITSYSGGPEHKRMECNMVLQSGVKIMENIKIILASMRGTLPYINGVFFLVIEKHYTISDYGISAYFDFNINNVLGTWSFKSGDVNTRYNRVKVTFPNEDIDHKADEIIVESTTFRAEDQRLLEKSLTLKSTTNVYRALDIASIFMRRSRQQIIASFIAAPEALQVRAGTIVTVTHPTPGWNLKLFRVANIKLLKTANCKVTLTEHEPTVYDLSLPNEANTAPDTNLPDPTNVPDLTGVVLTSDESVLIIAIDGTIVPRLYATWDIPDNVFINGYDVEYKPSADSIWLVGGSPNSIGSNEIYIDNVTEGVDYDFRVKSHNSGGFSSIWNETFNHTIVGKTSVPADVLNLIHTILKTGVDLSWDANSELDIGDYEIRVGGADWDGATFIAFTGANKFSVGTLSTGTTTYRVKARDTGKRISVNDATTTVTVSDPAAPGVSSNIIKRNVKLNWNKPTSTFTVVEYNISYTHPIDGLKAISTTDTNSIEFVVDWGGSATFHVAAVDEAGNVGPEGDEIVVISSPVAGTISAQVIDNNVLLAWPDMANTLPISQYEIRKGDTYGASIFLAFQSGTYAFLFETAANDYTYWITGVDTANNFGFNNQITVSVAEPPDFVLLDNTVVDLTTGTYINSYANTLGLLNFGINLTETWDDHFDVNNSFAHIQDQIDAGFPYYIQPIFAYTDTITDISSNQCTVSSTTGLGVGFKLRIAPLAVSAEEGIVSVLTVDDATHFTVNETLTDQASASIPVRAGAKYETIAIDYGIILNNLSITANITGRVVDGDPPIFFKIRISEDDITYTDFAYGANKVFADSFRYVKIVLEVTADSGEDLYEVSALSVVVNVKEITDSGTVAISGTGGTTVTFNKVFIDVSSIALSPIVDGAAGDFTAIADFEDIVSPTEMDVRLYLAGVEQSSGNVGWIIRGF